MPPCRDVVWRDERGGENGTLACMCWAQYGEAVLFQPQDKCAASASSRAQPPVCELSTRRVELFVTCNTADLAWRGPLQSEFERIQGMASASAFPRLKPAPAPAVPRRGAVQG